VLEQSESNGRGWGEGYLIFSGYSLSSFSSSRVVSLSTAEENQEATKKEKNG
jgi:hypothetical protein